MSVNPYEPNASKLHALADFTRREFLMVAGGIVTLLAFVIGGFESFQFLFPNTTTDPPLKFIVDVNPSTISVDNPYSDYEHRICIVLDDAGFYCVQLVCTHLGCTPNYYSDVVSATIVSPELAEERGVRTAAQRIPNGWACPCHGSRYFIDSTNFYGPAPRPMDWVHIEFTSDGTQFLVDRSTLVVYRNPGQTTPPLWRCDPVTGLPNNKTMGV